LGKRVGEVVEVRTAEQFTGRLVWDAVLGQAVEQEGRRS